MNKFEVTSITVKKYRIICLVQINGKKYSDVDLKNKLLKKLPNLVLHKCKNANNERFEELLEHTSLAHVFEHMVIDLQISYAQSNGINCDKAIFGTTEWLDKDKGTAKVELSYYDDIDALRAINEAQTILNNNLN